MVTARRNESAARPTGAVLMSSKQAMWILQFFAIWSRHWFSHSVSVIFTLLHRPSATLRTKHAPHVHRGVCRAGAAEAKAMPCCLA